MVRGRLTGRNDESEESQVSQVDGSGKNECKV